MVQAHLVFLERNIIKGLRQNERFMKKIKKKKYKILLTRSLQDFALRDLQRNYDIQIHRGKIPMPKKNLVSKIKDKDGLICFPFDTIDKDVIKAAKKLKTISTYSVGYDHIDVKYSKKRKISIGYTPDVLTNTTADLTLALILDLLRRVSEGDRIIRNGKWIHVYGADEYVGTEVSGKFLGVLGLGRIGRAVAKRAHPLGMTIFYHNRKKIPKKIEKTLHVKYLSVDALFKKCDIISLHIPYTKNTHEPCHMHIDSTSIKEAKFVEEKKSERTSFGIRFFDKEGTKQFSTIFAKMYDKEMNLDLTRKKLYEGLFAKYGNNKTINFVQESTA